MVSEKIESYRGWTLRSKRVGVQGGYGGMAWPGSEDDELNVPLEEFEVITYTILGKGAQQRALDVLKKKVDGALDSKSTD